MELMVKYVTFKGSQDIRLPELTSTHTKFNLIPRGSKGQSIAQAHKGFFIRPNNFITKQSGSGVAVLRLCVELCCVELCCDSNLVELLARLGSVAS